MINIVLFLIRNNWLLDHCIPSLGLTIKESRHWGYFILCIYLFLSFSDEQVEYFLVFNLKHLAVGALHFSFQSFIIQGPNKNKRQEFLF